MSPFPPECYLQSGTKIEPDPRLTLGVSNAESVGHLYVISARHTSQCRGELWEIIQLHLCARFLACELMYFLQKAKFNAFVSIKHRFNPRHDEKSYVFHLIFVSRSQHNFAVRFQFVLGKGNQCCACLFRGGGDPRLRLL